MNEKLSKENLTKEHFLAYFYEYGPCMGTFDVLDLALSRIFNGSLGMSLAELPSNTHEGIYWRLAKHLPGISPENYKNVKEFWKTLEQEHKFHKTADMLSKAILRAEGHRDSELRYWLITLLTESNEEIPVWLYLRIKKKQNNELILVAEQAINKHGFLDCNADTVWKIAYSKELAGEVVKFVQDERWHKENAGLCFEVLNAILGNMEKDHKEIVQVLEQEFGSLFDLSLSLVEKFSVGKWKPKESRPWGYSYNPYLKLLEVLFRKNEKGYQRVIWDIVDDDLLNKVDWFHSREFSESVLHNTLKALVDSVQQYKGETYGLFTIAKKDGMVITITADDYYKHVIEHFVHVANRSGCKYILSEDIMSFYLDVTFDNIDYVEYVAESSIYEEMMQEHYVGKLDEEKLKSVLQKSAAKISSVSYFFNKEKKYSQDLVKTYLLEYWRTQQSVDMEEYKFLALIEWSEHFGIDLSSFEGRLLDDLYSKYLSAKKEKAQKAKRESLAEEAQKAFRGW